MAEQSISYQTVRSYGTRDRRTDAGKTSTNRGFTLVELLVVVGIIAVLVGLLMPALTAARQQARAVTELSALRQLMAGFYMYANDNAGRVLPGYADMSACDENGNDLSFPVNARYPWRLVRYLGGTFRGAIVVNERADQLGPRDMADPNRWNYLASVFPSFGMNIKGVGGSSTTPTPDAVRKLGQPSNPTELIVFGSSRYNASGYYHGYFEVKQPPAQQYNENAPAVTFGFIDPRHRARSAAVGLFDGHAELMNMVDLTDPRHWRAAKTSQP